MHAFLSDAGATLAARYGISGSAVIAAGAGDNAAVNCAYADRLNFGSVKVVLAYTATLSSGKSLSISAFLQDADDGAGTNAAPYGTAFAKTVVATAPSGGATVSGVIEFDFNLLGAREFINLNFTPDMSAAGTDTAKISVIYVLCGSINNPATASVV